MSSDRRGRGTGGVLEEAARLLARRSLTRAELTRRLTAAGHAPADIENALARLSASGALDDRALARSWIATRVQATGRGRERALLELAARGVPLEVGARAWDEALADGEVDERDLLARAVRRRLGAPPGRVPQARVARVYNALLSEGFEPEALLVALLPYGFERTAE